MSETVRRGEQSTSKLTREVEEMGGALTPEWTKLTPLLERSLEHETGVVASVYDRNRGLAEFITESCLLVEEFEAYPDYTGDSSNNKKSFISKLLRQVALYESLIGIHGVSGRERSFRLLAHALELDERRSDEVKQQTGSYPATHNHWRRRLRANVLEELGLATGDTDLLRQSIALNSQLINSQEILAAKEYRVHAAFSRFDLADRFMFDPSILTQLDLPQTPEELQVEFYKQLAEVAQDIGRLSTSSFNAVDSCLGTLAEIIVCGYLRDTHIQNGLTDTYGVRQAFIHEDVGRYSRHLLIESASRNKKDGDETIKITAPSTSFDLAVYDRRTGEVLKIDCKKGNDSGESKKDMPDIIRVFLEKNGVKGKKFVREVKLYALAQARYWSVGPRFMTRSQKKRIDTMLSDLDITKTKRKQAIKIGKTVLGIKP